MSRYLDYAATTPLEPRVLEAMMPYLTENFGNANSLYSVGRTAARALEEARETMARLIGAKIATEFVFTSGGTESNNSILYGVANRTSPNRNGHIITSSYEHHAILEPVESLRKLGYEVTLVKPRPCGHIHPDDVKAAIQENTFLISIMHANNEIGAVNNIKAIADIAHEAGAYMHTDAAQSLGKIPFNVQELGVDFASFSAHKIYGPKGVGGMYVKRGTKMEPYLKGGGQENKKRSGTQNVAGAVGFAKALEISEELREEEAARAAQLRDSVITQITSRLENTEAPVLHGERLPGIASLLIKGVEGESMLLFLDNEGFAISTGSACSSGSLEPSHVLLAIGVPQEVAHGSLRVSIGRDTTQEDIDDFVEALVPIVDRLRMMNPVYKKMFPIE